MGKGAGQGPSDRVNDRPEPDEDPVKGRSAIRPGGVCTTDAGVSRGDNMAWIDDWAGLAACRATDPDALFVQGAAQNRAKAVCLSCPVRTECLADALDNRIEFGVWGGMTERERRALLRRRPDVTSWHVLLQTARDEFERVSLVTACSA
jgi:WhiB family redox-sensing transcriptional regulator